MHINTLSYLLFNTQHTLTSTSSAYLSPYLQHSTHPLNTGLVPYIHAAAKGLKPYFLRCILQAERTVSRLRELALFRLNYEVW